MSALIDILGSYLFGGILLLAVITLNRNMAATSQQSTADMITQQNCVTLTQILQNDFYKIGYGDSSHLPFISADSTSIRFLADMNDDSRVDTVRYYTGRTDSLSNTVNPRDFMLYRIVNSEVARTSNLGVTGFKLVYFDTTGAITVIPNRIKSILVKLDVESPFPDENGNYVSIHWEQMILSKGLKY